MWAQCYHLYMFMYMCAYMCVCVCVCVYVYVHVCRVGLEQQWLCMILGESQPTCSNCYEFQTLGPI